jgi:hypothetical protein
MPPIAHPEISPDLKPHDIALSLLTFTQMPELHGHSTRISDPRSNPHGLSAWKCNEGWPVLMRLAKKFVLMLFRKDSRVPGGRAGFSLNPPRVPAHLIIALPQHELLPQPPIQPCPPWAEAVPASDTPLACVHDHQDQPGPSYARKRRSLPCHLIPFSCVLPRPDGEIHTLPLLVVSAVMSCRAPEPLSAWARALGVVIRAGMRHRCGLER